MAEPISLSNGFVADLTIPVPKSKPLSDKDFIKSFSDRENVIATLLGESRGEKIKGSSYRALQAVANVIDNRSKRKQWNKHTSLTGIVKQKNQFEVWKISSDHKENKIYEDNRNNIFSIMRNKNTQEYKDAEKITDLLLKGELKDITDGSDHFYNPEESTPPMASRLTNTLKIKKHQFMNSLLDSPYQTPKKFLRKKPKNSFTEKVEEKIPPSTVIKQPSNLAEDRTEQSYYRPYEKIFPELSDPDFSSKYGDRTVDPDTMFNTATEAFIKYPNDFTRARKYFLDSIVNNSESFMNYSMTGKPIDYSRRKVEKKKEGGFIGPPIKPEEYESEENKKRQRFLNRGIYDINNDPEENNRTSSSLFFNASASKSRRILEGRAKFGPITLTGGYVNEKERKIGTANIPTFGPKGEFTGLNKTPVVRSSKNKRIKLDGIPLLSGETPLGALSLTGFGEYAKSKEQVDVGKFKQVVEGRARTAGLNLSLGDDFKIVYTHIENKQTGQQKTTGQSINAKYVVSKTPEGEVTLYVDLGPKQEGSRKKTVGFNVKQRFEEGGFVSAT